MPQTTYTAFPPPHPLLPSGRSHSKNFIFYLSVYTQGFHSSSEGSSTGCSRGDAVSISKNCRATALLDHPRELAGPQWFGPLLSACTSVQCLLTNLSPAPAHSPLSQCDFTVTLWALLLHPQATHPTSEHPLLSSFSSRALPAAVRSFAVPLHFLSCSSGGLLP